MRRCRAHMAASLRARLALQPAHLGRGMRWAAARLPHVFIPLNVRDWRAAPALFARLTQPNSSPALFADSVFHPLLAPQESRPCPVGISRSKG
jgi:hypothetical protein